METGIQLISKCDELWVFGGRISEGMAAEILVAEKMGLKVRRFNEKCEPLKVD
jgi:hypothetical protein